MPTWLRVALRWTSRALLGLLLVVMLVVGTACAYLSTEHGRARLLRAVVTDVNRLLPGSVTARELSRLTPTSVVLQGLSLRARGGNEVITLDRVRARIAPWSLLEGRVEIREIVLENAMVDLRSLQDDELGLVPALVDLSPEPEPIEGGPPPSIVFGGVLIENCQVRLPQIYPAAPDELWLTTLRGRVGIGAQLQIDAQQLKGRVRRGSADIGGVRASVQLRDPGRSHLEAVGTLDAVEFDADLTFGDASSELSEWQRAPFELQLALRELTAERFATLTGLAAPPLLGSFGTQLALHGTALEFEGAGALQTPGGALSVNGRVHDLSRLELAAETERLALRSLTPSLPDRSAAARLDIGLEPLGAGRSGLRASLAAATRLDGVALPRLSLRAEHASDSAWQLQIELDDRWLALAAQGQIERDGALQGSAQGWLSPRPGLEWLRALGLGSDASLSGALAPSGGADRVDLRLNVAQSPSGELDANASLGAARLALGAGHIEQLAATLSLAGRLPRPRLRLSAAWQAALRGASTLTPGRLELGGGPSRYDFDLHAGAPGALRASGWVARERRGERFALSAAGRHGPAPWRVEVKSGVLLDTGDVLLPGVDIEVDEQRMHLEGQYAGTASQLVLELQDVNLRRALGPFLQETQLTGVLDGRVEARGSPSRPELSLSLRATRFGLLGAPTLDASLEASLDSSRGSLAIDARARERGEDTSQAAPRLDAHLQGSGSFDPKRPWPALLATGEQRLRLDVARLDSALLDELVDISAPASFDGRGHAELRVVSGVPTLDYSLDGRLGWVAQGGATLAARQASAQLKHTLSYAARRARTELALDDAQGRWLALNGDVELPPELASSVATLSAASAADWARWLRAASWHVALDAAPRPVDALPALAGLPELGGADLGLQLAARREPGESPAGSFAFQVSDNRRGSPRRGCSPRLLTTHGHVALQSNRFGAALQAFDGQTRLLHASTGGQLDVERWLGGERPSLSALEIAVDATRLPLDGLPLLCGQVRGELSGSAKICDPLGAPQLNADLAISRFSLGSDETVDVDAKVSIDPRQLDLQGNVQAEGRRSPLAIDWQLAADGTKSAAREASFEFTRLPIAPLLPLEGPISHVSGYVSGQLKTSVGGEKRALSGSVRLEQVALTVTELAQSLNDIGGEISFRDGAVVVRRLTGRDGDGEVTLDGNLQLYDRRSFDGNLTLTTRKFPLRQAGDIVAQTSATARIELGWRPELHRLRVALSDFETWLERSEGMRGLSLEPHPDVKLTARSAGTTSKAAAAQVAAGAAARVPFVVEIDAAQQFWVKRADFALKLSATLQVATGKAKTEQEQGDIDVTGKLEFERGYMEMLGKSFEVKRGGTLRFTGGTAAVLDLSAEYEDRRTDKLVLVRLQGSADAPKLEFQVDGRKVSAGEAFQAIYGSNASSDDVDPEAQADQIVGALMAGVLTTSMRRRLGSMAPILSVDAADEDRGEQLRAGFELDALIPEFLRDIVTGVYVEGSISSDKQADQAGSKDVQKGVLIELHFPYNLVSSGRYGPDTTWSLDLGWQP